MRHTRILVADGCPILCQALRDLLRAHDSAWVVCAAAVTGPEAVERALAERPDIVIIDDQMPLLSGLEAAAEIKRHLRRVRILIFSGSRSRTVLRHILESGVAGCLLKSEAPEELVQAVRTVGGHHQFRSRGLLAICAGERRRRGKGEKAATRRELEAMCLIAAGHSTREVAGRFGVSAKTVESHRSRLFRKFGFRSVVELTHYAIRHGLVEV